MADLRVGCTYDRDAAVAGAVGKTAVANGESFAIPLHYLPTATRKVYIVVEGIAGDGETNAIVYTPATLTLEGVWLDGDARPADTLWTVNSGSVVRVVLSYLDDGNETALSDDVQLVFSGDSPI